MLKLAGLAILAVALLGMLARVPVVSFDSLQIDLAVLLIFGGGAWWIVREWTVGLPALGASIIAYLAGASLPFWLDLTMFVCAVVAGAVLAVTTGGLRRWQQRNSQSSSSRTIRRSAVS